VVALGCVDGHALQVLDAERLAKAAGLPKCLLDNGLQRVKAYFSSRFLLVKYIVLR